ncbi:MAG: hypothetical protein WAM85_04125, partial [Terracidiphilus sp.]
MMSYICGQDHQIRKIVTSERGDNFVEYALIIGLAALITTACIATTGGGIHDAFDQVSIKLSSALYSSGSSGSGPLSGGGGGQAGGGQGG